MKIVASTVIDIRTVELIILILTIFSLYEDISAIIMFHISKFIMIFKKTKN